MRTEASIKNSFFATFSIVVRILIGFLAQKVFVLILNAEYLGANGLFSNIIGILNLAELGIGQAIIFNLYKPIANDDKETIKSLMGLYRKSYNWIILIVSLVGIAIIPFLDLFIGETTLELNFTLVYVLFLIQSVTSYVLTYKRSILYAYQENYLVNVVDIIYVLVSNIAQLVILHLTKNYYLYLGIKSIAILIENLVITALANKRHGFINEKDVRSLEEDIEKDIFARIKAQIFHKIGSIVITRNRQYYYFKIFGTFNSWIIFKLLYDFLRSWRSNKSNDICTNA